MLFVPTESALTRVFRRFYPQRRSPSQCFTSHISLYLSISRPQGRWRSGKGCDKISTDCIQQRLRLQILEKASFFCSGLRTCKYAVKSNARSHDMSGLFSVNSSISFIPSMIKDVLKIIFIGIWRP